WGTTKRCAPTTRPSPPSSPRTAPASTPKASSPRRTAPLVTTERWVMRDERFGGPSPRSSPPARRFSHPMIELDVLRPAEASADKAVGRSPRVWRSAEDRADAPGYAALREGEFLPGATEEADGPSRRTFLKVMGASMALAGLTGCRRPVEQILPYARKPVDVVPGIANFYATAFPHGGVVHGLLVESHEGRPTKVEGNPEHPVSRGKTDVFAQASLLNLYDPDRSRFVRRGEAASSWAEVATE